MSGHIRQRSAGSYELRYSLGADAATGRRKVATTTFRGSRKDAEKELRRLMRAVDTGEHVDPNRISVREWLSSWLDMVRPEVSPVTHERYGEVVRDFLAPALGNIQLARLAPAQIQGFYSDLAIGARRDGKPGSLAPATRRFIHRVLSASLSRAAELQMIPRNPAQVLRKRLPRDERREMAVLTPDEAQQLLAGLQPSHVYWPTLLALVTGARRGEVLGLRWRHVELDRGVVRIVDNLVQVRGAGLKVKAPKSGKQRSVTLPPFAIDELRRLKKEQAESLFALGVRQSGATPLCLQPDGSPITPNVLTNAFSRMAKRLGFPIRFHSLRHTHATHLLLAGVHPKVAQERLGHASIKMTLDIYSHVAEKLQDDAAARIEAAFQAAR